MGDPGGRPHRQVCDPRRVPNFAIRVRSDEPIRASQALHKAQLPTIGPAVAGYVEASGTWTVGEEFTVYVSATDAPEALERVRRTGAEVEVLGDPELQAS